MFLQEALIANLLGVRMSHARVVDHVKRLWILLVLMGVPMMQAFAQPSSGPERRIAFVIGIGAYKNAPRLPNPVNLLPEWDEGTVELNAAYASGRAAKLSPRAFIDYLIAALH